MYLQALIFDVDGTLAETEEAHRKAFNLAFADADLDWHWSPQRYRELLAVSGGKERILRFMQEDKLQRLEGETLTEWVAALHQAKTQLYTDMIAAGDIELRQGVERLIREARQQGLRLAIATTTSMANVTALFAATLGDEILSWFEVIGAAEQAAHKKPDASIYVWVLEQLGLAAENCLAIEDTHNGVRAATGAGIAVLVTQSFYSEGEDFSGALAVLSDLGEPHRWCRQLTGPGKSFTWVTAEQLTTRHAEFVVAKGHSY
jgi:HAD superfamily hydrolase (TIGR01509 family)